MNFDDNHQTKMVSACFEIYNFSQNNMTLPVESTEIIGD